MGRRKTISSVRASRTLSRCASWSTNPGQRLDLPIRAEGLSEITVANGRLQLSPDYDLLALLCERWLARPTESGWMRPTLYELAATLYPAKGRPPGGEEYRMLRESIQRLAWVSIEIIGFNAETGKPDPARASGGHLLEAHWPLRELVGDDRFGVRLAEWLRSAIDHGAVIRLDWRTLRSFNHQQLLAKRLWIYLQAESYKPESDSLEATWLALGDRLNASLGMNYAHARQARAGLKRACGTVLEIDPRYRYLAVEKRGQTYQLVAKRLQIDEWNRKKGELRKIREATKAAGLRAST